MSKSKKGAKPEEKDIKITEEEEIVESEAVDPEEDAEVIEETEEAEADEGSAEETVEEDTEEEKPEDKKPEAKKADEDPANSEFVNLPFIEKCKKDPVIPVSLLLAFIMIIVAVIYFLLPGVKAPTMNLTLDEFENGFNSCDTTLFFFESGFDIDHICLFLAICILANDTGISYICTYCFHIFETIIFQIAHGG